MLFPVACIYEEMSGDTSITMGTVTGMDNCVCATSGTHTLKAEKFQDLRSTNGLTVLQFFQNL